jgi:CRISPR-associated protein Csd1
VTVLQALAERYDRLAAAGKVPVPGYGPAQIGFAVVLDTEGGVVTVDDLRVGDTEKKKRPRRFEAPQPPKRTVAVASGAFWDKTSYVFGRSAPDPKLSPEKQVRADGRTAQEHAAFKARQEALIGTDPDPGLLALLRFLRGWRPESYDGLRHAEAMLDGNVGFRLDGDVDHAFIHERPAARAAFQNGTAAGGVEGTCLVTGRVGPIARLHPSIKGVPGAQSSGAALVSFNLDAFSSYGKQQGFNAPVSEAAAFAYATALNDIVAARSGVDEKGRPRWSNRVALGEDTVVFWVERPELEGLARGLVEPPDEDDDRAGPEAGDEDAVRERLRRIADGEPVRKVIPDVDLDARVYILGLSPNAARLSVRFWLDQKLGDLAEHVQQHWKDLDIRPAPRGGKPKLWALLYEIAPLRKPDKGIQHLAGEMTRAILAGTPYPASLLTQALMRVRAETVKTTPNRVSLIKAVLARQARRADPDWKDNLVALDRDEPNVGYRLGRLFAVLDAAQYAGIGAVNATVKDKFFAAASSTPGHIFPILLRGVQDHLSAARKKNKKGRAYRLDGEIREILAGIAPTDAFPATLSREDQGRFVVGFYHQDADLRTPRDKGEEVEARTAETDTTDHEDEGI